MRLGKLDNDELERLVLGKFSRVRKESLYAPEIGRDCAAVDLQGDLTVLSTDPITSASVAHLGRLTVHVCCNDAAAAGAEPVGLLVTLLVPPTETPETIGRIADDLAEAARLAGIDILGGHTEVTDSVTRAITSATIVARMQSTVALTGMQPGDDLVMTKWAGLEGTTILAEDAAERLSGLPADAIDRAHKLSQYLSVVAESKIAMQLGATEMHDVTEGGVLGAVWEMAYVSGCGITVQLDAIPVLPETAAICKALSLNPLRLISSGSMLITCKDGKKLLEALQQEGIPAAIIGKAVGNGVFSSDGRAIDPPGADELYHVLAAQKS